MRARNRKKQKAYCGRPALYTLALFFAAIIPLAQYQYHFLHLDLHRSSRFAEDSPLKSGGLHDLSNAELRSLVRIQNSSVAKHLNLWSALQNLAPAVKKRNTTAPVKPELAKKWCLTLNATVKQIIPNESRKTYVEFDCHRHLHDAFDASFSRYIVRESTSLPDKIHRRPRLSQSTGLPRIVHAINLLPPSHGMHMDQDVTLQSMQRAVAQAAQQQTADVTVLVVEAFGDEDYPLPAFRGGTASASKKGDETDSPFVRSKALRRTVLESPHMKLYLTNASTPRRPLPLLTDILGALSRAAVERNADYVVFTNADIGLQPEFYRQALRLVSKREAVAINRVEIDETTIDANTHKERKWDVLQDMDRILTVAKSRPQHHHGYDCFVWKAELTPLIRVAVGNLCVGYPPLGNVLVDAMKCASPRFAVIKGEHLTFHIGIKNGGWGLHRDEYEGYNRLSRKMAEATLISLGKIHLSPNSAFLKCIAKDGTSDTSASQHSSISSFVADACVSSILMKDKLLFGHATGLGALLDKEGQPATPLTTQYKRGKGPLVSMACSRLRGRIYLTASFATQLDKNLSKAAQSRVE